MREIQVFIAFPISHSIFEKMKQGEDIGNGYISALYRNMNGITSIGMDVHTTNYTVCAFSHSRSRSRYSPMAIMDRGSHSSINRGQICPRKLYGCCR